MQRSSNEDAGLRTKSFRVIVRTSDLVNTPVQNHFVSQFRLRILDQHSIENNPVQNHFVNSDFGSWKTIQWILTKTAGQHHFVSQVGLRILDQNSSGSWNKLLCNIISCHCSDFIMLDTKSIVKLVRITIWTSDLGLFHRFDFRSWIETPVDLGKKLRRTMFSCHSSDSGS